MQLIKGPFSRQYGVPDNQVYLEFVSEIDKEFAEYESFQVSRKIFGAIGLFRCGSKNFDYEERIPNVPRRCLLCFEPGEGFDDEEGRGQFIVIPNQGEDQIRFYLQTVLNDFVTGILGHLEEVAKTIEGRSNFPSPKEADLQLSKDTQKKLTTRMNGRRLKLLGDLYLLGGAYSDAVNVLATATEETKSNADNLWHAGAQESLQIALTLQNHKFMEGSSTVQLWTSLAEKLIHVGVLYEKSMLLPRITFDCYFLVAGLYRALQMLRESDSAIAAGWQASRNLPFGEKVSVLVQIISFVQSRRRNGFYRQLLSEILAEKDVRGSLALLEGTFEVYRVDDLQRGWCRLKQQILEFAVDLSVELGDRASQANYTMKLLSVAHSMMEEDEQLEVWSELRKRAASKTVWLPILDGLELVTEGSVFPRTQSDSRLFIYAPNQQSDSNKVGYFVAGESIKVAVQMSNPFAFDIHLDDFHLEIDVCERVHVFVKAKSRAKFLVHFSTMEAVTISRCKAKVFGYPIQWDFAPLNLQIVPPQPLVKIVQPSNPIFLFEGERHTFEAELRQLGPFPASGCVYTITHDYIHDTKRPDWIVFGEEPLALSTGDDRTLRVQITGRVGLSKIWVSIEYGMEYFRRLNHLIEVSVQEILTLQRVSLVSIDSKTCMAVLDIENKSLGVFSIRDHQLIPGVNRIMIKLAKIPKNKLSLNAKQFSLLKKENFSFDAEQFYAKQQLIQNLPLEWKVDSRSGFLSFYGIAIENHKALFEDEIICKFLSNDQEVFGKLSISQPENLEIQITSSIIPINCEIKISLEISENIYTDNYTDIVAIDGPLQFIISDRTTKTNLTIYPLSTGTLRIKVFEETILLSII